MNMSTDWPDIAQAMAEIVSAVASILFFVLLLREHLDENQSDYRPAFVELLRRAKRWPGI